MRNERMSVPRSAPTPSEPGKSGRWSDYYTGVVTRNGITVPGRHGALIDLDSFERVQSILAAQNAGGSRGRTHRHYLSGHLSCSCGHHYGYGRHRGKLGGIYEYYSCLSRVGGGGPCGARYLRLQEIEEHLETIHQHDWLTHRERELVREAVKKSLEVKSKVARDEAKRHERRLAELKHQQKRLLELYYQGGVSIELMREEQERIDSEGAQVRKWQHAAEAQIDDVLAALDEALLLIDRRSVRYEELPEHERRLLNLAIFDDFLIEEVDDEEPQTSRHATHGLPITVTPHYEQTYVVLRQFADAVTADENDQARRNARGDGALASARQPQAALRASQGLPNANPSPRYAGQGSHKDVMAERGGFEPPSDRRPETVFERRCRSSAASSPQPPIAPVTVTPPASAPAAWAMKPSLSRSSPASWRAVSS